MQVLRDESRQSPAMYASSNHPTATGRGSAGLSRGTTGVSVTRMVKQATSSSRGRAAAVPPHPSTAAGIAVALKAHWALLQEHLQHGSNGNAAGRAAGGRMSWKSTEADVLSTLVQLPFCLCEAVEFKSELLPFLLAFAVAPIPSEATQCTALSVLRQFLSTIAVSGSDVGSGSAAEPVPPSQFLHNFVVLRHNALHAIEVALGVLLEDQKVIAQLDDRGEYIRGAGYPQTSRVTMNRALITEILELLFVLLSVCPSAAVVMLTYPDLIQALSTLLASANSTSPTATSSVQVCYIAGLLQIVSAVPEAAEVLVGFRVHERILSYIRQATNEAAMSPHPRRGEARNSQHHAAAVAEHDVAVTSLCMILRVAVQMSSCVTAYVPLFQKKSLAKLLCKLISSSWGDLVELGCLWLTALLSHQTVGTAGSSRRHPRDGGDRGAVQRTALAARKRHLGRSPPDSTFSLSSSSSSSSLSSSSTQIHRPMEHNVVHNAKKARGVTFDGQRLQLARASFACSLLTQTKIASALLDVVQLPKLVRYSAAGALCLRQLSLNCPDSMASILLHSFTRVPPKKGERRQGLANLLSTHASAFSNPCPSGPESKPVGEVRFTIPRRSSSSSSSSASSSSSRFSFERNTDVTGTLPMHAAKRGNGHPRPTDVSVATTEEEWIAKRLLVTELVLAIALAFGLTSNRTLPQQFRELLHCTSVVPEASREVITNLFSTFLDVVDLSYFKKFPPVQVPRHWCSAKEGGAAMERTANLRGPACDRLLGDPVELDNVVETSVIRSAEQWNHTVGRALSELLVDPCAPVSEARYSYNEVPAPPASVCDTQRRGSGAREAGPTHRPRVLERVHDRAAKAMLAHPYGSNEEATGVPMNTSHRNVTGPTASASRDDGSERRPSALYDALQQFAVVRNASLMGSTFYHDSIQVILELARQYIHAREASTAVSHRAASTSGTKRTAGSQRHSRSSSMASSVSTATSSSALTDWSDADQTTEHGHGRSPVMPPLELYHVECTAYWPSPRKRNAELSKKWRRSQQKSGSGTHSRRDAGADRAGSPEPNPWAPTRKKHILSSHAWRVSNLLRHDVLLFVIPLRSGNSQEELTRQGKLPSKLQSLLREALAALQQHTKHLGEALLLCPIKNVTRRRLLRDLYMNVYPSLHYCLMFIAHHFTHSPDIVKRLLVPETMAGDPSSSNSLRVPLSMIHTGNILQVYHDVGHLVTTR